MAEEELRHVQRLFIVFNVEEKSFSETGGSIDDFTSRITDELESEFANAGIAKATVKVLDAISPQWAEQRQVFFDNLIKSVNES